MRYESKEEAQESHVQNYRSDGIAKRKGTRYSSDFLRVNFIMAHIDMDSHVLDVGCNGGTISVPLMQQKGCYVNGVDIVPELVKKAQDRGVFAMVGEAEDLSQFRPNSFDHVICSEVLEHLYDPLPAIREAYRVLKPSGSYLVTVPHPFGEMAKNHNLGDYHQQNFTLEILDTIFHNVFERGKVEFFEIPYSEEFCVANGLDKNQPQWLGLKAVK
jgi:ubiquinone/menaquinone biosynthesis C-methylase UbiE